MLNEQDFYEIATKFEIQKDPEIWNLTEIWNVVAILLSDRPLKFSYSRWLNILSKQPPPFHSHIFLQVFLHLQYSSTQTWHSHTCLLLRLRFAHELATSARTCLGYSMTGNTRETRQITRVESHCVNYRLALRVSCSWLCKSLTMGFFSLQMTQFM